MFMLLAVIPAVLLAWSLGGRFEGLVEHRFRRLWLIWAGLGVQVVLFTPLGNGIPDGWLRVAHVATYLPIIAFLAVNRDAGLAIVATGATLNLIAIGANGGLMPADPVAQEVFFRGDLHPAHAINTDASADRLLVLGDVMALPSWFPFANAFSIGDVLLALGICWAIARLTSAPREDRPRGASSSAARDAAVEVARRAGAWTVAGAGLGWALAADGRAIAPAAIAALVSGRAAGRLLPRAAVPSVRTAAAVAVPLAGLLASVQAASGIIACLAAAGALLGMTAGHGVSRRGLAAMTELAAAGLGLAAGSILVTGAGLAALVLAGAPVLLAAALAARDGNAPGADPIRTAMRWRLRRVEWCIAGGLAAIGAATVVAARTPAAGALTSGRLGLVAGAVAAGGLAGLVMAFRLTAAPKPRALGMAVLFAAAATVLAASARNPMTLVLAAVTLGLAAGGAGRLARPYVSDRVAELAWAPVGAGAAAGAAVPAALAVPALWALSAVGAIGALWIVARHARAGLPALKAAAT